MFDPATGKFSDDDWGMSDQLMEAWPVHTYPHVMVAPDGGGVVSAGSTLVRGWCGHGAGTGGGEEG